MNKNQQLVCSHWIDPAWFTAWCQQTSHFNRLITIIQFNRIKCQLCYKSFDNAMPHTWQFSHNLFPTSEYNKKTQFNLTFINSYNQWSNNNNTTIYVIYRYLHLKKISNVISSMSNHRIDS